MSKHWGRFPESELDVEIKRFVVLYFELLDLGVREFVGESGIRRTLSQYSTEAMVRDDAEWKFWSSPGQAKELLLDFVRYQARKEADNVAATLLDGAL